MVLELSGMSGLLITRLRQAGAFTLGPFTCQITWGNLVLGPVGWGVARGDKAARLAQVVLVGIGQSHRGGQCC